MPVHAAHFHFQLRLAFTLERRQQREHLRVFRNLWRVKYAFTLPIIVGHFLLQVHRDQLIVHHFQLAVAELEIGAAHIFAPLMGLHNPDTVLFIRGARGARHIVNLLFVLRSHAHRIL